MDTASIRRMMGLWLLIPELFHLRSELADGEGWAGLVDALQLAVTDDLGIRVVHLQRMQQCKEGLLLSRGAGVGSMAFLVETALVADTNGMGIVVAGMSSDHRFRATEVELTVAGDVVVIAAAFPATGLVHLVEHPQ